MEDKTGTIKADKMADLVVLDANPLHSISLRALAWRTAKDLNLKRLKLNHHNGFYHGIEPVLIQAFYAGESADAIPADQIILYPNKEILVLMPPKGGFRIRAIDKSGKEIGGYKVP